MVERAAGHRRTGEDSLILPNGRNAAWRHLAAVALDAYASTALGHATMSFDRYLACCGKAANKRHPLCTSAKMNLLYQSMLRALSLDRSALIVASAAAGFLLTLVAVLAGVLGAWRLGADPGWTNDFFITDGLLSRYQLWFTLAIGAQMSALNLNRWVANQSMDLLRVRFAGDITMTPMELAHFRGVLEARKAELEHLLSNREAIAVDSTADLLDQIQHASEREMAIGSLERESARLREVQAALRRIDLGTFAICLGCAAEISPKRLAAVPWTASCLACREAADGSRIPASALERPLLNAAGLWM